MSSHTGQFHDQKTILIYSAFFQPRIYTILALKHQLQIDSDLVFSLASHSNTNQMMT